jgi:hypothetical protein
MGKKKENLVCPALRNPGASRHRDQGAWSAYVGTLNQQCGAESHLCCTVHQLCALKAFAFAFRKKAVRVAPPDSPRRSRSTWGPCRPIKSTSPHISRAKPCRNRPSLASQLQTDCMHVIYLIVLYCQPYGLFRVIPSFEFPSSLKEDAAAHVHQVLDETFKYCF